MPAAGSAAQHSQSLHAWLSHIPGLKVVVPSTPYDAKGLMKSAIRDDNPVAIFEDKMMYRLVKGPVPEGEYTVPLGVADIKRPGDDLTVVATSSMVHVALEAAGRLAEIGLSADGAFYYLDAPVKRLGAMNVPVPFSPVLEDLTIPNAEALVEMARTLCGRS